MRRTNAGAFYKVQAERKKVRTGFERGAVSVLARMGNPRNSPKPWLQWLLRFAYLELDDCRERELLRLREELVAFGILSLIDSGIVMPAWSESLILSLRKDVALAEVQKFQEWLRRTLRPPAGRMGRIKTSWTEIRMRMRLRLTTEVAPTATYVTLITAADTPLEQFQIGTMKILSRAATRLIICDNCKKTAVAVRKLQHFCGHGCNSSFYVRQGRQRSKG